jgi:L-threonylcarbamoyladenylate synthase
MRILKLSETEEAVAMSRALEVLQEGGVIVHATETCFGLACDLTNPKAVAKLFAIKQRPEQMPVSALFPSVDEAKKYVEWNDRADTLAKKFLPGALTIILPLREDAPQKLYPIPSGGTSIGVRISSHAVADHLATSFGKPLSTTSANPHGDSNPYRSEDIVRTFEKAKHVPDLFLDSGSLPMNPPSTVVNLCSKEEGIVRKGTIQPMDTAL